MTANKYPDEWMVVDHVIPGVTAEMIDWWWVNMEKGYELWCPEEHKGFKWEVEPPPGGHIPMFRRLLGPPPGSPGARR